MMTLPAKYAVKVGLYDVMVHNTLVKVRVVDNKDTVSLCLSELKLLMGENMIVGIVAKEQSGRGLATLMIVLCVKSRCLIIQVCLLESIPQCLTEFLEDREICFVGPDMKRTLHRSFSSFHCRDMNRTLHWSCLSGMELGDLAAKILLDPTFLSKNWTASKSIAEHILSIADKAGVTLEKDIIDRVDKASIDLRALAFSPEQLKCLVANVYASYLIAAKLLGSL